MYSFILTLFAGFSTLLGSLLLLLKLKQKENIIVASLSFAAGVMICVSFIELIPEGFKMIHYTYNPFFSFLLVLLLINIGIIVSSILDHFTVSKQNHLYKVGIISMLAIIMHNIPEGIATFLAANNNRSLGLSLAIAIAFHNIPEGIGISIPIYYATQNRKKAFFYTLISGISEPFGAILAFFFLKNIVTDTIMGFIFAFIAGIMIYISVYELLKEVKTYKKRKINIIFFIIGILFMTFNHLFFG